MNTVVTARTGLLSRIAEAMFWTGRYMERADDSARMVDVYVHRMLEEPSADEEAGCRALLAVLGIQPPETTRLNVGVTLEQLVYDIQNPSAIAGAVKAARSGARSVRQVISGEMWECLNVAALRLPGEHKAAERLGPHVYLRFIRERAALFFGLADSTMSHDDAWLFLLLGQSVERADMTARMLLARMPVAPNDLGWQMLLQACGAHESFLRTGSRVGGAGRVVEFLVLDRMFPRSARHALATAEECLVALGGLDSDDGGSLALVRQMRSRLESAGSALLPGQLTDVLGALLQTCLEASEAIAKRYFADAEPAEWEEGPCPTAGG